MAEQTVYQSGSIQITTARVAIGGSTYQLRNIAGVRVIKKLNVLSIILLVVGGLIAFSSFGSLSQGGWQGLLLGIGLIALALWMGLQQYYLHFDTSSGSVSAYKGKRELAHMLKQKIEDAMAGQG
jgi:type III secretory pathway component EscU